MNRRKLMRILPWVTTPGLVVLLLVAWQLAVTIGGVNSLIFPSPLDVSVAGVQMLGEPDTWENVGLTVTAIVTGFLIAVVTGVLVGVVLGKIPWLEVSLRPLIVISQVVPKVAFVPLFVIWFGFGITSKIVLATLLAFFPVMLNVLLGVRSIERGQREVMQSLNANRIQTFSQLEMRGIMPYLFAGMEVAIVLATIGAIVGEYIGGNRGLGAMVVTAMNALDSPRMFAIIGLLSVIGLGLYLIVNESKRFFIPWHESVYTQRELAVA
ncbi:ABC transporter permease [Microbacterium marinilacus]|uniref:ABC transporter permease n=1 Tax=Microbacterium marinilacus TaxID=415209 RepID=A0ABP7BIR9_9MICO|nr:ABC transporter permease [Microbacterium marinilacus]MBY0689754.1 ABC transporter permease [Microbacterium marinilacus]